MANVNQRIAPPIPLLTAAWAGMSREDIMAGLRNGDIVRPERLPDWAAELDDPTPDGQGNETGATPRPVDRARVDAWFQALDPGLSSAELQSIWDKAGATDAARGSNLTSSLSRLLLDSPGEDAAAGLDALLRDRARRATVVDLSGKTGEELAALARTDVGYRYALANLDNFAATGNRGLFSDVNADGALDRFDADTGEALVSDAWLDDRGKFLAWKLAGEAGRSTAVAGTEDWTFIDRGTTGADGTPLKLEITTGASQAGHNQVVFGTAADEMFKGVAGSDRIYAGAGDDVLRGGAGGDRLEGGDGDDLALGGSGNDELTGGRGDDELDGGAGDDRLEGGSGDDTYVIEAGDGADTIVDAGGIGTIELDGRALRGTMQGGGGKWTSAEHNVEFALDGDPGAGGTLTISTFAEGASHDGPAQSTITVRDWKNGDLGIALAPEADGKAAQASPLYTLTGPEVPVVSSADLASETWAAEGALPLAGAGGEGAIESQFDFNAALDSLLGNGDQTLHTVDPASYAQALEAFSGVLVPPDVSTTGSFGDAAHVGAVTEAAMSDALAADYAADALDAFEPAQATPVPDVDVAALTDRWQPGLESRATAGR